ncbi:hydrogenase expression/formation protein HypE [Helicobacter pylori]|uniref:hydrogenase expression/formation protein HypE n=1 Tax=Helicobacter pylori TaxID=210 RepID=UPI001FD3205A|nr:hydrogenase expression/formation protein HypE [Helicobacter pylori]UOR22407.1 hydrogenase expression/formation protein HypE [Helicobacter pylori]
MDSVTLACGNGGKETNALIERVFMPYLKEFIVAFDEDAPKFKASGEYCVSTDSFVITPLIFNGGDIGKLCVCGSANDVSVQGGEPLYLNMGFILEEGLEIPLLKQILQSIQKELLKANLKLLSLDTKVVPKGSVDKLFINTTCIGKTIKPGISSHHLKQGQAIIISDTIANHGASLFAMRHEIKLKTNLESDCQLLYPLLKPLFLSDLKIHALRDATRGGLASVLNEWANSSKVKIVIEEEKIPLKEETKGICEILGLEPYALANEGVFVLAIDQKDAPKALEILKSNEKAKNACVIGEVFENPYPSVVLKNAWGFERILEVPEGELLPRIC